jgi:hypothetical protein
VAAATAAVQQALERGSAGYGWSHLGYILAVACGLTAVVWETQAALAYADFAPASVRRRATILLAGGSAAVMVGCVAGGALAPGGVAGVVALALVASGLCALAGGGASLLATRGAEYAARKVDERLQDDWK